MADPSRKSGTRPRTEPERRQWLAEVGPVARQAMERLIELPAYKAVPDPLKRRIMESVRSRVTSEGNARVDEGKNERSLTEQLVQGAVESVALDLENDRERAAVQRVLTAMRSGSALPPGTEVGTVRRAFGEATSDAVNGVFRQPAEQAIARAEASRDPEGELTLLAKAPGLVGSLARRRLAVLHMVKDTATPRSP